jgi:hypothetical protein
LERHNFLPCNAIELALQVPLNGRGIALSLVPWLEGNAGNGLRWAFDLKVLCGLGHSAHDAGHLMSEQEFLAQCGVRRRSR